MNVDGSNLRQVSKDMDQFSRPRDHLFPAVSPDGKHVVFEAFDGNPRNSHIGMIGANGSSPKDLGVGCLPTFSPDGKRISIASFSGMMMMDADGSNREVKTRNGWSWELSPDGSQAINYTWRGAGDSRIANLLVVDMATGGSRLLLEGDASRRYGRIAFNADWSPDGQEICFAGFGGQANGTELVVVSAKGSSHGMKILHTGGRSIETVAWSPDGTKILFPMESSEFAGPRLHLVDCAAPHAVSLVKGQPMDRDNRGAEWSPDGKQIYFSSQAVEEISTP